MILGHRRLGEDDFISSMSPVWDSHREAGWLCPRSGRSGSGDTVVVDSAEVQTDQQFARLVGLATRSPLSVVEPLVATVVRLKPKLVVVVSHLRSAGLPDPLLTKIL